MRQTAKIITAAFFLSASLFFGAGSVYAEGLNVSADKENCEIGDTVTVTVDATALEGTAPADIQVEFNANRLSFVNCSAQYGGGGGGLITFKESNATVEFTTLSGGTADVKVTAIAEDAAEPETASVSVAVAGEDTAAASDGRVIQTVFAEEFKPILFHKETTDYNGQMVECAKFDMGDMTLLYTTDASGADGKFMIYNQSTGTLDEFRMLQGIENRFIIVLADCEGEIPAGYTKAVLDWNGQTLTAFMEESVAAGSATAINGVDPADFFLVYAMSSEGNKGWYRYDKNEGTYQRFVPSQAGPATEGELQEEADETVSEGLLDDYIPHNIQSILLIVFAALALILLITVIILAVNLHEYAEDLDAIYEGGYYEDDEEEDDEDEDDEEEDRHVRRGGAVTAASLVGRSMSEEDEQDEEDEEDDEDDDSEEDEEDVEDEEPDDEEGEDDEDGDEEEDDEEEDDDDLYERPLTRRERKELERERKEREREEKWRLKGSFEKEREQEREPGKESEQREKLPPRKKVVRDEEAHETEQPRALREEEQRERQRRLFEQQQRIEEQRRIENERLEAERIKQQQQFIDSRNEEPDLDEDFQFEFLNLD